MKEPSKFHTALLNVNIPLRVELGRARLTIKQILELGPGSTIELGRLSSEDLDIYANDKIVARGEIVQIDNNFGVRVTENIKNIL